MADTLLYLEDLVVGATWSTASITVTEEMIHAFAQEYDPQPFHLDAVQATESIFGRLVASGWHTVMLTMRLIIQSDMRPAGGHVGLGIEGIQWPQPVLPGDTLHAISEIVEVRPSQSRPDRGIYRVRITTLNDRDEVVLRMTATMIGMRKT